MSREVTIELKTRLKLSVEDDVHVATVVHELDYEFKPTFGARLLDSEVLEYEVTSGTEEHTTNYKA